MSGWIQAAMQQNTKEKDKMDYISFCTQDAQKESRVTTLAQWGEILYDIRAFMYIFHICFIIQKSFEYHQI